MMIYKKVLFVVGLAIMSPAYCMEKSNSRKLPRTKRQMIKYVSNDAHRVIKDNPLHDACRRGNLDDVKEALTYCDVNAVGVDGKTALHIACAHGSLDIVKTLVIAGARCYAKDFYNNTPLHEAYLTAQSGEVRNGKQEYAQIIQLLTDCRADHTAQNNDGKTPPEMSSDDALLFNDY